MINNTLTFTCEFSTIYMHHTEHLTNSTEFHDSLIYHAGCIAVVPLHLVHHHHSPVTVPPHITQWMCLTLINVGILVFAGHVDTILAPSSHNHCLPPLITIYTCVTHVCTVFYGSRNMAIFAIAKGLERLEFLCDVWDRMD